MDEAALRAWLAEPRTELIAAVAEGVRAHVAALRADGLSFYGYALYAGANEFGGIDGFDAVANAEAARRLNPPQVAADFREAFGC